MALFEKLCGALRSQSISKVYEKCLAPVQWLQVRNASDNSDKKPYGSRFGYANWQMKKDHNRRECVREHFPERMRINAIRKNTILPIEIREAADEEVAKLPRDSNPIRLVARCVFTSRPKGVRRKHRVSRIVYRDLADHGKLSGVTHARW